MNWLTAPGVVATTPAVVTSELLISTFHLERSAGKVALTLGSGTMLPTRYSTDTLKPCGLMVALMAAGTAKAGVSATNPGGRRNTAAQTHSATRSPSA